MDNLELPNTDSPEVMQQAISCQIAFQIWEQISRIVHDDEAEQKLLNIYSRVYASVKATHES